MSQKVAVAIIHGIGRQVSNFADKMSHLLSERCRDVCGEDIVCRSVYWAPVLQDSENALWERLLLGGQMDFMKLRRLMVDFVADAVAYQVTPGDRFAYDGIHSVFARTLRGLARDAGPNAPLCIIAHSLGSIIASNFIYDLQTEPIRPILSMAVREEMEDTPLENGETLSMFYTLGSPIALWSLRYREFGRPVNIPDPRLVNHYPTLGGEWINFYDEDDVFGFPLKSLNDHYRQSVAADMQVNIGSLLGSWSPASHIGYWDDPDVLRPVADGLIATWRAVNEGE
jgi:hypothetical protein